MIACALVLLLAPCLQLHFTASARSTPFSMTRRIVVHNEGSTELQLNPLIEIRGDREVNVPIWIPESTLKLNGNALNSILAVKSSNSDREYGAGDHISISIIFGNTVILEAYNSEEQFPVLELSTGCNDESCTVIGEQQFECRATSGKFAVSFNGQTIPNVDATSSVAAFQAILTSFDGIVSVNVSFDGNRQTVCTEDGNTITVRFVDVNWNMLSLGDIPLLSFDYLNAPIDGHTMRSWSDGTRLCLGFACEIHKSASGSNVGTYSVIGEKKIGDQMLSGVVLSPTSFEVVKGMRRKNNVAEYVSGNGTESLEFLYIVSDGDMSERLDYAGKNALMLGSYYIFGANLTLPVPGMPVSYFKGTGSSLSLNNQIVINTGSPMVKNVISSSIDGIYGTGDEILIEIIYNQPIYANLTDGYPRLELETGIFDHHADLYSVLNSSLLFQYIVKLGDSSSDLDYKSVGALVLNGAKIYRNSSVPTTFVDIMLPEPGLEQSLSANKNLVVRPCALNALGVSTTALNGTYGAGDTIMIDVEFGWWIDNLVPVQIVGTASDVGLVISVGSVPSMTIFNARTGTCEIEILTGHTVAESDIGRRYVAGSNLYVILNILQNNIITLNSPWLGIDVLNGIPYTQLISDGTRIAYYFGGNRTSNLSFKYLVQPNDFSMGLDYFNSSAFMIPASTNLYRDSALNFESLIIELPQVGECVADKGCSLSANHAIVIDTAQPKIIFVSTTKVFKYNAYGINDVIDITVHYDRNVSLAMPITNSTLPKLRMSTGNYAYYYKGNTTTSLTFLYQVYHGDMSAALEVYNNPSSTTDYALNMCSSDSCTYVRHFTEMPTTDADNTFPAPMSAGSLSSTVTLKIDTSVPAVQSIAFVSPVPGNYGVGENIEILVTFDLPVFVSGYPYILLNNGGRAVYSSGSSTKELIFLYTVLVSDSYTTPYLDLLHEPESDPPSASIIDSTIDFIVSGTMSLPINSVLSDYGISITTAAPMILNVGCNHIDNVLGIGEELLIYITFDTPVVVIGPPPILSLDVGDTDAPAYYISRGTSSSVLIFSYIVLDWHSTSHIDYTDQYALTIPANSSIVRESTGSSQAAILTLPTNGQFESLGMNCDVSVNTTVPTILSVFTRYSEGTYGFGSTVQTIEIVWDSDKNLTGGSFSLRYGPSKASACISITTISNKLILEAGIESINSLIDVEVSLTDSIMGNAIRFQVSFVSPVSGIHELWWDESVVCDSFTCNGIICSDASVVVNRDLPEAEQLGVLELLLLTSHEVIVSGTPLLYLELDNGANATAVGHPGSVQYVDVGIYASSRVLDGYFRILYNFSETECIHMQSADSMTGAYGFKARLEEFNHAALIGILGVSKENIGNGIRFSITFASPLALAIGVPASPTTCTNPLPYDAVVSLYSPNFISFVYTPKYLDTAQTLVAASGYVNLNGSTIMRSSTFPSQSINHQLPESRDLRVFTGISIDCSIAPKVVSVIATCLGGSYAAGQRIYFAVTFDSQVIVNGSPLLYLNSGPTGTTAFANFFKSNGDKILSFQHMILQNQSTSSLKPYSVQALTSNGGSITSANFSAYVHANITLPKISSIYGTNNVAIVVNTTAPLINSVTFSKTSNNTYGEGEEMLFLVQFNVPVSIFGNPYLKLNSNGYAIWTRRELVQVIDVIGDGDEDIFGAQTNVTSGGFRVMYNGELTDCVEQFSNTSLMYELSILPSLSTVISGSPTLKSVGVTQYMGGYRFTIVFSGGDGVFEQYPASIEIPWNWYDGCEPMYPTHAVPQRADTNNMSLLYTVQSGESTSGSSLRLVSGASLVICCEATSYIRSASSSPSTDASLQLPLYEFNSVYIDTSPPVVLSVSPTTNGVYGVDQTVLIMVTFSTPVYLISGSNPILLLTLKQKLPPAKAPDDIFSAVFTLNYTDTYADKNGTALETERDNIIMFEYTVRADDYSYNLVYTNSSALSGSIRRLSSHPTTLANLTLPALGSVGSLAYSSFVVIIGAFEQTKVQSVYAVPSQSTFVLSDKFNIVVQFTRPFRVISKGLFQIQIYVGMSYLLNATLSELDSATDKLIFEYTVLPGHTSQKLDYTSFTALKLIDGAAIVDESFRSIDIILPYNGTSTSLSGSNVIIMTTYYILSVDSLTPDGTYHVGESIYIRVNFSSAVMVIGIPLMMMQIGPDPDHRVRATYIFGSGTSQLIFEYIVEVGDHSFRLGYDGQNAISFPTTVESKARIVTLGDLNTDADTSMPEAWSANQLGRKSSIKIYTETPVITGVTTDSPDGSYGIGESIILKVNFNTRVWVKNSKLLPYLQVIGDRVATYFGGNNTSVLKFLYEVQAGDDTDLFDYRDTRTSIHQNFSYALQKPSGAEIKAYSSRPTVDALLVLARPGQSGSISASRTIVINTSRPSIHAVTVSSLQSVYSTDDIINITVQFTYPVVFTGFGVSPSLLLNTQQRPRIGGARGENRAIYASGNGTDVLHLQYTVQPGDYTPLLDYIGSNSLSIYPSKIAAIQYYGGRATRTASVPIQDADLRLAVPGSPLTTTGPFSIVGSGVAIAIQTRYVKAVSVSSFSPDGTYPQGSIITIKVLFTTAVEVLSSQNIAYTPVLMLDMDVGDVPAVYTTGSGSNTLTFEYIVRPGDSTPHLDYSSFSNGVSPLQVYNNSIVEYGTGEPVYINSLPPAGSSGSLGTVSNIAVYGDALFVRYVSANVQSGVYGAGQKITINIYFIMPLIVDPPLTATLKINVRNAAGYYITLLQSSAFEDYFGIEFIYTVKDGDYSPENETLDYFADDSLSGTFKISTSHYSSTVQATLPSPFTESSISGSSTVIIDTTPPYVVNVSSSMPNGMYPLNSVIDISVYFSAPVSFDSDTNALSSKLLLDVFESIGGAAIYAYGNGTNHLVYRYTVLLEHGSSDLEVTDSNALFASGLKRLSTTPTTSANIIVPIPGTIGSLGVNNDIIINPNTTKVIAVSTSRDDGAYGVGEVISIEILFSTVVMVLASNDSPYIKLNSGAHSIAEYVSGNATDVLTFDYVVLEGDSTPYLNYTSVNSLISSEKLFSRTYDNGPIVPLAMQLPTADVPENFGYSHRIEVDTSIPIICNVTSSTPNGVYGAGEIISMITIFSTSVIRGSGNVTLYLDVGNENDPLPCYYSSGDGTTELIWLCTIRLGDISTDLSLDTRNGEFAIRDGTILRYSTNPSQNASLSAPSEGLSNSLSGSKDIKIDTSQPKVWAVASRRSGTVTVGQVVDFHVIFDGPVKVSGFPTLAFPLDDGSIRYAKYDMQFSSYLGPGESTFINSYNMIPFTYVVQAGDMAEQLGYYDSDSLELNGGSIRRYGVNSITDAILTLPSPSEKLLNGEKVLIDSVFKVEVILHGLYHEYYSDLEVSLKHEHRSATLINGTAQNLRMGLFETPYAHTESDDEIVSSIHMPDPTDQGYNMVISGICGPNLALSPGVNTLQSSTALSGAASKGTDSIIDGIFSNGGSTLTEFEDSPWWQIQLEGVLPIGHIRILGSIPDTGCTELQFIEIQGTGDLGGKFLVTFGDQWHGNITSDYIDVAAPCAIIDEDGITKGTSVEAKLQQAVMWAGFSEWLSITVHRCHVAPLRKYRRSFTISMKSAFGDMNPIVVTTSAILNAKKATVTTIREGTIPGPIYYDGAVKNVLLEYSPSWLLVFESALSVRDDMSLDEAKNNSVYSYWIDGRQSARELNIAIPNGIFGEVIRIQLMHPGQLSLAEVEIYAMPFKYFNGHIGKTTEKNIFSYETHLPEDSPSTVFEGTSFHGQWILQVSDTSSKSPDWLLSKHQHLFRHGDGVFGGWSITLIDYFGNAKIFTSDAWISIETIPHYGSLKVSLEQNALSAADGYATSTDNCLGKLYGCVVSSFFERLNFPPSSRSAVCERNRIRRLDGSSAMKIYYKPLVGYIGPDSFTYSVTVDGIKSLTASPVILHVKQCRLYSKGTRHILCVCHEPQDYVVANECFNAVIQVCMLGKTHQLPHSATSRLCHSCASQNVDTVPLSFFEFSSECLHELFKFTMELEGKGYCSESYNIPICLADMAGSDMKTSINIESYTPYELAKIGSWQSDLIQTFQYR